MIDSSLHDIVQRSPLFDLCKKNVTPCGSTWKTKSAHLTRADFALEQEPRVETLEAGPHMEQPVKRGRVGIKGRLVMRRIQEPSLQQTATAGSVKWGSGSVALLGS